MMRVKAGPLAKKGWFPNGEYVVLGLRVNASGKLGFVVEDVEFSPPGIYAPGEVVITDGRLPSSWRASMDEEGNFYLDPEEFTFEFSQALVEDGNPAAWETYRRVKKRLEAESR
jgi:hypothetical protein